MNLAAASQGLGYRWAPPQPADRSLTKELLKKTEETSYVPWMQGESSNREPSFPLHPQDMKGKEEDWEDQEEGWEDHMRPEFISNNSCRSTATLTGAVTFNRGTRHSLPTSHRHPQARGVGARDTVSPLSEPEWQSLCWMLTVSISAHRAQQGRGTSEEPAWCLSQGCR